MHDLKNLYNLIFEKLSGEALQKITLSNPFKKNNRFFKIFIVPKKKSENIFYQFTYYYETKVQHENYYDPVQAAEKICALLTENYKQCDIISSNSIVKILMNRKSQYKIITTNKDFKQKDFKPKEIHEHNIKKEYILQDGNYVEWVYRLGLSDKNGKILSEKQKKFRQINKFLEIIADVSPLLSDNPTIIDFGCGKSYLTFALYYYLQKINKKARIIGLDIKPDVVEFCQKLAVSLKFDGLDFILSDIKDYQCPGGKTDMVITLHACDTATDYALYNAIKWNSAVILSVPCCQHELFGQIKNDRLRPIIKHGILKERFSTLLTDAIRANILEIYGYDADVMEFIETEHTPKNILIRAVKKKNSSHTAAIPAKTLGNLDTLKEFGDPKQLATSKELETLIKDFDVSPTLYKLLLPELRKT